MKPEIFVRKIKKSIVDENLSIYRDLFCSTELEQAQDPYWQDALALFENLTSNERDVLFKIMRQVSVDTVSSFFSILDGISVLDEQEGEFSLLISGKELSGSLQDDFLELEEQNK